MYCNSIATIQKSCTLQTVSLFPQFNPLDNDLYEQLGKLYGELYDMFGFETFHYGGRNVDFRCWNASGPLTDFMSRRGELAALDDGAFVDVWSGFQARAAQELRAAVTTAALGLGAEAIGPVEQIVWASKLTKGGERLPPAEYAVQVRTRSCQNICPFF